MLHSPAYIPHPTSYCKHRPFFVQELFSWLWGPHSAWAGTASSHPQMGLPHTSSGITPRYVYTATQSFLIGLSSTCLLWWLAWQHALCWLPFLLCLHSLPICWYFLWSHQITCTRTLVSGSAPGRNEPREEQHTWVWILTLAIDQLTLGGSLNHCENQFPLKK